MREAPFYFALENYFISRVTFWHSKCNYIYGRGINPAKADKTTPAGGSRQKTTDRQWR